MAKAIGVIGGTGVYSLVKGGREEEARTPFGVANATVGSVAGRRVVFIPRHGRAHEIAPHKVNYRANLWALKEFGAGAVLTSNAVGVISKYAPGDLVVCKDFIAPWLGPVTFFDDFSKGSRHTDMSAPYSTRLAAMLASAAKAARLPLKKGGVVTTTFGPRYESPAEISALKKMGASLVSMTSAYEVILANELKMEFASIAVGTNWAAGVARTPLSHEEVLKMMASREDQLKRLFAKAIELI